MILVVRAGAKIDRGPKSTGRVGFGVLIVGPFDGIIIPGYIITQIQTTGYVFIKIYTEITTIPVSFFIIGANPYPPGTVGKYISGNTQVKVIIQGKIITSVPEIKASVPFFSV